MLALVIAVLLLGLMGFAFLFIWHPMRQFFGLREEVRAQIAKFEKERTRWKAARPNTAPLDSALSKTTERQLLAAEREFHELAIRVKSFAETERLATLILRKMQLDPGHLGAALSSFADAVALKRTDYVTQQRSHASGTPDGKAQSGLADPAGDRPRRTFSLDRL